MSRRFTASQDVLSYAFVPRDFVPASERVRPLQVGRLRARGRGLSMARRKADASRGITVEEAAERVGSALLPSNLFPFVSAASLRLEEAGAGVA